MLCDDESFELIAMLILDGEPSPELPHGFAAIFTVDGMKARAPPPAPPPSRPTATAPAPAGTVHRSPPSAD